VPGIRKLFQEPSRYSKERTRGTKSARPKDRITPALIPTTTLTLIGIFMNLVREFPALIVEQPLFTFCSHTQMAAHAVRGSAPGITQSLKYLQEDAFSLVPLIAYDVWG
jgi:hypothetical protein